MHPVPDFAAARTFDAALDRLADATQALGFDAVNYGYLPRARAADGGYHAPTVVGRNFPRRWLRGWTPYLREDPLIHASYPRTLPLDWKDVEGASWLMPIHRQAFDFIRVLGFGDGVTVPIHLPDNGFAFVTVAARAESGVWRTRKTEVLERLLVIAHAFQDSQASGSGPTSRVPRGSVLSAREQVVLACAAIGLNAPETAERIHRSVETVRIQRKSAMRKLGAHTIAQAVARAVNDGSITVEDVLKK
ncbi:MAG: LuxR family transcriptional regulator [Acidobacteria bacterium]|nr:LuxR family transcriptional regulator [Acidobacteriota bacterium]